MRDIPSIPGIPRIRGSNPRIWGTGSRPIIPAPAVRIDPRIWRDEVTDLGIMTMCGHVIANVIFPAPAVRINIPMYWGCIPLGPLYGTSIVSTHPWGGTPYTPYTLL